jgi:hypothetical protein
MRPSAAPPLRQVDYYSSFPASQTVIEIIYLVIDPDVCGGPMTGYSMLEKLQHSLQSLRRCMPDRRVHVYSFTFDGTEHPSLASLPGVTMHHMGQFQPQSSDPSVSASDNLLRDILLCKIETVAAHPTEAVFVDVDTEWVRPLPEGSMAAALHTKEAYSLSGSIRSLAGVWPAIGRSAPPASFAMWNSGFIYIPLADKMDVLGAAQALVSDLERQPGKHRLNNVLDEQLSLSYAMQLRYGETLGSGAQYLQHKWQSVHAGHKYWMHDGK